MSDIVGLKVPYGNIGREVGVEVHAPTGQVRLRESDNVVVFFAPAKGPGRGSNLNNELYAQLISLDDRLVVSLHRLAEPWFDCNPAITVRLEPDTGRGEYLVVTASGGDRRGSDELGSAYLRVRRLTPKPKPPKRKARKVRRKRAKAEGAAVLANLDHPADFRRT